MKAMKAMKGDPPKESLGEDLLELLLSLYPPTAMAGMLLSADDAAYAVKDMVSNPRDIGFNRDTFDNALDILSVIPFGRTAAKSARLGEGLIKLTSKASKASNLNHLVDAVGFVSDRAQEKDPTSPVVRRPKPMNMLPVKPIKKKEGKRTLAPRAAPNPMTRIQPEKIRYTPSLRF